MTTPCDVAWKHLNVDVVLPPLTAEETRPEVWKRAFNDREQCLQLFEGNPPFFKVPGNEVESVAIAWHLTDALAQAANQNSRVNWRQDGLPNSRVKKEQFVTALTAEPGNRRPFGFVSTPHRVRKAASVFSGSGKRLLLT